MYKSVNSLLLETKDTDPDIRFMALNDLDTQLHLEAHTKRFTNIEKSKYSDTLLRTIDDEFDEVRVQTLKCLSTLGIYCPSQVNSLIDKLLIKNKMDKSLLITSSIYTMAIHNVLKSMAISDEEIGKNVCTSLISYVASHQAELLNQIDFIELINDMIEFAGKFLDDSQISLLSKWVLNGAFNADTIISKKCTLALKYLMNFIKPDSIETILFTDIWDYPSNSKTLTKLSLSKSMVEGNPKLIINIIPNLFIIINSILTLETNDDFDQQLVNDELKIHSFYLLESIWSLKLETGIGFDLWNVLPSLISYDPYKFNSTSDSESEDDRDDEDAESEDDYLNNYDDEEDNEYFCWKVRLRAVNSVQVFITNHPLKLNSVYATFFESILNQLKIEKNKMVIASLISLLSILFKLTSSSGAYYSLKSFQSITNNRPRSKSDVTMSNIELLDPLEQLCSSKDLICDLFYNQVLLNYNSSNKNSEFMQLYYDFVINLTTTTEGLNSEYLNLFIIKLHELFGSAGVTSAESKLYISILKTNSIKVFNDSSFNIFLNFIKLSLSNNANHKVTIECLQLCNDIFGVYFPRDRPQDQMFIQLCSNISDLLILKISNRDLSIDIRKGTLMVLCSLTLITSTITESFANSILNLLEQTINIDLLVHLNLSCMLKILKSGKLNLFIKEDWVNNILSILLEYIHLKELQNFSLGVIEALNNNNLLNDINQRKILSFLLQPIEQTTLDEESSSIFGNLIFNCYKYDIDAFLVVPQIIKLNHFNLFVNNWLMKIVTKLLEISSKNDLINMGLKYGSFNDPNIAKFIAIIVSCTKDYNQIDLIIENLKSNKDVVTSLIFLNEISKHLDLNYSIDLYLKYLGSNDGLVQTEAIRAVSTLICRNPKLYLGVLLKMLNPSSTDKLPVLKTLIEVTKNLNLDDESSRFILNSILQLQAATTSDELQYDEPEILTCAQCLAQLIHQRPEYLNELVDVLLSDDQNSAGESDMTTLQVTISAVTKYLLLDFNINVELSDLSKLLTLSVKRLIGNTNLIIKTIGVENLNLAITKKPILGIPILSSIISVLMDTEIKVNKAFVRIQHIGPFKNKIDDGLTYRKQIYESIYYIFHALEEETSASLQVLCDIDWSLYVNKFYGYAVKDDISITSVGLLTLNMMMEADPDLFFQEDSIHLLIERSRKVLNKKLVDTAVKQDIEKQQSLQNLVLRFLKKTKTLIENGSLHLRPQQLSEWGVFATELRFNSDEDD